MEIHLVYGMIRSKSERKGLNMGEINPLVQVLDIFAPVLIHFGIFQLTAMLLRGRMDAGTIATLAAIITWIPVRRMYQKEKKPEKKGKWYTLWITFVLGMTGNLLFSILMNRLGITEQFSNATQEALFQSNFFVQIIGIGILVPLVEELIFRGLVYGKLRMYYGRVPAVLFSALLFSVYHGNMIQMLYALPMGILLALVYEKWGMLAAPVLFHIGANLLGVIGAATG